MEHEPPFLVEGLRAAVQSMANQKAPGLNAIETESIKVVAKVYPYVLLNMFNICLQVEIFSS